MGRPTLFTPELLNTVLTRISEGENERSIFRTEGFPTWQAWTAFKFRKAEEKSPESQLFFVQYAQAKDAKYEAWEDKIIEIAKDDSRDIILDAKGNQRSDNTAVNRDRLQIDSMKWLMSKALPKKYGEKITQELTGAGGGPVRYEQLVDRMPKETPEQWTERVNRELQERAKRVH